MQMKRFYILVAAVILIVGVLVGSYIAQDRLVKKPDTSGSKEETYTYHVAMLVNDRRDVFWQSVYQYAKEAGRNQDIYVEDFGARMGEKYSREELLEMAIAAEVDGIIIEANNSPEMVALIDEATAKDITVITVSSDATGSKRQSFVSVNDYALGEMYGNQVAALKGSATGKVTVLLAADGGNTGPDVIFSGINKAIEAGGEKFQLNSLMAGETGEFESEEKIRQLLRASDTRPDVLVCLSAVDTISAYQCVVDYNLVGKVKIVGSYDTPRILEGVEKGIIQSTIVVSAEEMGNKAIQGMSDYLTKEYTSEYMSVESKLITRENVTDYLKEQEEQGEK